MNILNIDDFAQIKRTVVYGGVSYAIEELSVQQFINNMKAAEAIEKKGDGLIVSETFERAVASISQSIPSMPFEAVSAMKLPVMSAVLKYIRGDLEVEPVTGQTDAEGAEKKPD